MQAQATGSRRFGFNRIAVLALAIGTLAIAAAVVVLSEGLDLPFTSESQAVSSSPSPAMTEQHRIRFLEQNIQLPDGVLATPAQSVEQPGYFEQEGIWEYADLPGVYSGLDEYQPQPEGQDYKFLEENLWNVGPAEAGTEAVGSHRDEHFDDGLD